MPLARLVRRVGSPPPSGSSQIWVRGESASPGAARADRNASVFPSGLHLGLLDDTVVAVRGAGWREPSAGTVQIALRRRFCFSSTVVTTNAMVAPSGEKRGSPNVSKV